MDIKGLLNYLNIEQYSTNGDQYIFDLKGNEIILLSSWSGDFIVYRSDKPTKTDYFKTYIEVSEFLDDLLSI